MKAPRPGHDRMGSRKRASVESLDSGTVIHISDLSLKWNRRPPGRRAKGRAITRIGRLRQDSRCSCCR